MEASVRLSKKASIQKTIWSREYAWFFVVASIDVCQDRRFPGLDDFPLTRECSRMTKRQPTSQDMLVCTKRTAWLKVLLSYLVKLNTAVKGKMIIHRFDRCSRTSPCRDSRTSQGHHNTQVRQNADFNSMHKQSPKSCTHLVSPPTSEAKPHSAQGGQSTSYRRSVNTTRAKQYQKRQISYTNHPLVFVCFFAVPMCVLCTFVANFNDVIVS